MTESQRKQIASQKFIGMQVVDSKGAIVGTVRDFAVNIKDREILLLVETKAGSEVEVPLSNVSSIEDVILLTKSGETSAAPPASPPSPQTITCKSCGAMLPMHAKFCAKCGSQIR